MEIDLDARQKEILVKALDELQYDAADFAIDITALPGESAPGHSALTRLPRKRVTIHRISTNASHEYETYATGSWAAEVLLAVRAGRLE